MAFASSKHIGEANRRTVFNAVRRLQYASTDDLVRYTQMSQPTVVKWLGKLEAEGFLRRNGYRESSGGRPPAIYEFQANKVHLLGVAVEIPAVQVAVIDLNGRSLVEKSWTLEPRAFLNNLRATVAAFVEEQGENDMSIDGCGLAFSGFIDGSRGVSLATPRLSTWKDVPVAEHFEQQFGWTTTLNHHMDGLTLAELSYGAATAWRDFLFLDIGYGVGLRMVTGGKPLTGKFGNAGLIGHTTVVPNGRLCLCGNRGCLEEYVSERALTRRLAELTDEPVEPAGAAAKLVSLAASGNSEAADAVSEMIEFLAIATANAINVFDTPQVVIGGLVADGGSDLLARLTKAVKRRLQPILADATEVAFSGLPRASAAARGAALFELKRRLPFASPLTISEPINEREGVRMT